MFKHILLPTDGSPASEKAIRQCIPFAAEAGARITGIHVHPPFHMFSLDPDMLEDSEARHEAEATGRGAAHLQALLRAARAANVPCDTLEVSAEHPYEAIVQAADERHCD